ncbi:BBS1 [Mytilus edulis]|uniref:BBS1 n=1 Tax=Mytilus edulis TaxID=6550 RepID=A0A8S3V0U6_MYTED|nr:BBS1 [Mytilus edulis]
MSTVDEKQDPPTVDQISQGSEKWLNAYYDPVASLYTLTQCVALSDIQADGDWKLVIADLGTGSYDMKLKVYKGTNVMSENAIIDLPTGVVTFYMDVNEPRTPAVAVASGPYIYIYKNLHPYFKFTLPTLDVNPVELDLWNQVKEEKINIFVLREMLEGMRCYLTGYIINIPSLEKRIDLPSVPVFLSVTGLYDVEYRIVVACRNGCIYTLKRGSSDYLKHCIELNSQPVGLERINKTIYVGTMDETMHCFTSKGKKVWTVKLPASITTMETMDYPSKGFKGVILALNNCQVHLYKEKYLVNVISTEDIVTGLKFGRFGREDATLVMTTRGGGLLIKILKRNATFEEKDISAGPPAAQNTKLNVPKKTKLFVDQTMRERENAVSMHRTFQRDLYLLRLNTAREYAKSLENSMNPISSDPMEPLKLNATVQGIGPTFKLTVNLQNTSLNQASSNLIITFQYDEKLYVFKKAYLQVPMLVPGLNYAFDTFVECQSDKGISDNVKVFVLKEGKSIPIITGVISMPVSESLVVV